MISIYVFHRLQSRPIKLNTLTVNATLCVPLIENRQHFTEENITSHITAHLVLQRHEMLILSKKKKKVLGNIGILVNQPVNQHSQTKWWLPLFSVNLLYKSIEAISNLQKDNDTDLNSYVCYYNLNLQNIFFICVLCLLLLLATECETSQPQCGITFRTLVKSFTLSVRQVWVSKITKINETSRLTE